jgi:preprotein translocase subunit YajC
VDGLRAALPLLIFVLAFILLIVLPARSRARIAQRTRQMQESLTVGAEVMMTCGLHGRVAGLHDDTIDLEIAPGVVTRWARAAVSTVTSGQGVEPTGQHSDAPPDGAGRED